jgi:myo-inositol-1(or 4)-monophosphatase
VAAGWTDGFFETGLNPWDVAAGSLLITEAGGLIGNFTGESDFLHRREVVAGNPKIYAQLVQWLAPFSRVAQMREAELAGGKVDAPGLTPEAALAASVGVPVAAPAPDARPRRAPLRVAKRAPGRDA